MVQPATVDVFELVKPRPGVLYEPRVLWGQGFLWNPRDESSGPRLQTKIVAPNADSYFNGEKYPIVITGVNTLVMHPAGNVQQGVDLISQIPIEIGMRGGARYSLGQIRGLLSPQSSCDALEALDPLDNDRPVVALPEGQYGTVRSVTNCVRWDFDHPLMLPPKSYLEMYLSGRVPTSIDTSAIEVSADVNFYAHSPLELAQWPGNTITRTGFPIAQMTVAQAQFYYKQLVSAAPAGDEIPPGANLPFNGYFGGAAKLYPDRQVFTSQQSAKQQATFDLPMRLKGMSVGFQQHLLDNALQLRGVDFGPLAASTYAKIRTCSGGTQAWWWREGLPLAAAMATQTPAVTHKLYRPLALQPGQGFQLTMPQKLATRLTLPPYDAIAPQATFYLSFTGYAVIEA